MEAQTIQNKIYEIRGYKVMLDFDLATLYQTQTKVLKQAVRRNMSRFPNDFLFELTREEYTSLRSQIVTLEKGRGRYSKYLPFAFTEQGVAMLASILNSPEAIEVNIAIVRAFVMMRYLAISNKEIREKLKTLEQVYNKKFKDIDSALLYLMKKDALLVSQEKRKRIGFKTKS
ncbi:MAG TPA: ORF6N domain-containing protein [Saprospiraceae bacterium]|nr:ORF6N domain-containing protein [Saprospiraceae bacterium]HZV44147.1 ORF6N domain-containing protein [Saprospiraceae bacterium]